jgi:hypothetical protein
VHGAEDRRLFKESEVLLFEPELVQGALAEWAGDGLLLGSPTKVFVS